MNKLRPKHFRAGAVIFREGSTAGPAYLIMEGKVSVTVGVGSETREVAIIGEKSVFGEMSLIDRSPRSATITALEDVTCYEIDEGCFEELFAGAHPIARSLFEIQCQRLRRLTQQLQSMGTESKS